MTFLLNISFETNDLLNKKDKCHFFVHGYINFTNVLNSAEDLWNNYLVAQINQYVQY